MMIRREFFKTALAAIAGWFGMGAVAKARPSKPEIGQVWFRRGDETYLGSLNIIHFKQCCEDKDPAWGVANYAVFDSGDLSWDNANMWSTDMLCGSMPNWEYMGTLREFVGRGKVGI